MKIVYAVRYIEVEFGQRDEGWALYANKDKCISNTKEASKEGGFSGGYYGPERPLCFIEVPLDSIDKEFKIKLDSNGSCRTDSKWNPKFTGKKQLIK